MIGGSFVKAVTDLSLLDAFIIKDSNSGISANIFAVTSRILGPIWQKFCGEAFSVRCFLLQITAISAKTGPA
jgi:hypothetical protein